MLGDVRRWVCLGAGRAPGPSSFFPVLLEAREGVTSGTQPAWTSVAERAGAGRHGDISQDREEQGSNWSLGVVGTRVGGRVSRPQLFLGRAPLCPDQVRGCDSWL